MQVITVTMSLTLREGHRLRVFNRKVFVPKRNRITGGLGETA
jgi:hypothetical protein